MFNYDWLTSDPDHAGTQEYSLSTGVMESTSPVVNRDGLSMSIISSSPTLNTDADRQEKAEEELAYDLKPDGVESASRSFTRILFNNLPNIEASSLSFDIAVSGDASANQKMKVTVCIADSGRAYSPYIAVSDKLPEKPVRITTPLHPYGYMKQLEITVETPTEGVKLSIDDITINAQIAFSFSLVRFLGVWLFLVFFYALRPGSVIWRCRYQECPLLAVIPSAAFVIIALSFFVWETSVPHDDWNTEVTKASDEYAALAAAMVDSGHLYLDTIPPDYLRNMKDVSDGDERLIGKENIYDITARDYLQSSAGSPVSYKLDAAYYNGRYYVYFGVAPVMLAYIPYYVLTGGYLGNTPVIFVCLVIIALFSFLLISMLVRRKFCNASCGIVVLAYMGFLAASSLVYSIGYPSFYNVPVCFALALLSVGAYLLFCAYKTQRVWVRWFLVLFGVFCLVATLGCRPQITIGALIVGLIYLILSIRKKRVSLWDILAAAIPVFVIVGLLLLYNQMRFGSPFDFGANYNLTGNDMTLRGLSLIRGVEGMMWYMFGTPELSANFPFMERYLPDCVYAGRSVVEDFTCGLFFSAPFAMLTFVFAASQKVPRFVRVSIIICTMAAFGMALFDSEGAGIVIRYIQDFGYLIGAAFALGLISYDHVSAYGCDGEFGTNGTELARYHSLYSVAALLLAVSLVMSLLIWTSQVFLYLPEAYSLDYYDIKAFFDAWGPTAIPLGK